MKANYSSAAFTNASGVANIPANAEVEVRREDTSALAALWSDEAGTTPLANPFNADANGRFSFYANGLDRGYSVKVTKDAFTHTVRNQAIGNAAQRDVSAFGAQIMQVADAPAAALLLKLARLLFAYAGANVANVGTAEEDGIVYNMPADTLQVGDRLKVKAWGLAANNANAKAVRLYFGSKQLGIVIPANDVAWFTIEFEVVVTAVGAQKYHAQYLVSNTTVAGTDNDTANTTENTAAQITIKTTSDGGAAGDITWHGLTVEHWPAP